MSSHPSGDHLVYPFPTVLEHEERLAPILGLYKVCPPGVNVGNVPDEPFQLFLQKWLQDIYYGKEPYLLLR